MSRKRARHSLGKVERHKVERWIAQRLRSSIGSARAYGAESIRHTEQLAVAQELADMLCTFQEKCEG